MGRGTRAARLRVLAGAAAGAAVLVGCGSSGGSTAADRAPGDGAKPISTPVSTTPPATAPSTPPTSAAPRADGYDPARDAAADVAAAKAASARDGRPVLIDFGADWCPDCVVLGRTFDAPHTSALLGKYHVVRVDVGQFDHNLPLVARYVDLQTSGIPALAVVDAKGRTEVATNQGQFENARSMSEAQVDAFLTKWA